MASYVVMLPASGGDLDIDRGPGVGAGLGPGLGNDRAARAVFVRDGFSLVAFLIPLIWLLWQRLWIEAILVVAAGLLIALAGEAGGFGQGPVIVLSLLVNLLVGLEGNGRRVARLRRRGWDDAAVVWAPNLDEAEARFFTGPVPAPRRSLPAREGVAAAPVHPIDHSRVGLVGHRGGE